MPERRRQMEPIKLDPLLIKRGPRAPRPDPAFREIGEGLRTKLEDLLAEHQRELMISCCVEFCCVSWCCIQIS
jgi:hypothetical protein